MTRTRDRVDRKRLKQDELVNFVGRASEYFEANRNLVLGVAAGVVLVIVLAVLWARGQAQRASESDLRFAQVVAAFTGNQYEAALDLANTLQSSSPGTSGALLAKFIGGKCQMQLGKFSDAEQSFRAYLDSASKAPLYENSARQALAASIEAQGRFAEAANLYQEAAVKMSEPLASEARLDAARALRLAGSFDQARTLLQTLADSKQPETAMVAQQARIELAILQSSSEAPRVAPASNP